MKRFLLFLFFPIILFGQEFNYNINQTVNFRENASVKSDIIKVLEKNESITVIDSINNWYKLIDKANNTGFVSKRFIDKNVKPVSKSNKNAFNLDRRITIPIIILIVLIFILIKTNSDQSKKFKKIEKEKKELEEKYNPIVSIENEVNKLEKNKKELSEQYTKGKSIFDELEKQISLYKNNVEFYDFGLYEPIFAFDTSEIFKNEISINREKQKNLIRKKLACYSTIEWLVNGSKREGNKKTNRHIKLTLRAFNGECDTLISKVRWNNIKSFQERIYRCHKVINQMNEPMSFVIDKKYLVLKIDELKLNHEYKLKKQREKEEERKARALIREEEKARRDFENAQKNAEKEKKLYNSLLEKAKKELNLVSGKKLDNLQQKINDLEKSLDESNKKAERAKSMAQQTKRGHVYVVSNVGSFGEGIYKIGMTRRLDPIDRVKELGDASVPFVFDKHAMIYTEDAPKLESLLHSKFSHLRVNKVNNRKEYFKVSIEEIENCIEENFEGEFELIKNYEAKEFRETQAILNTKSEKEKLKNEFPEKLF
jgi:hypothetical protein